MKLHTLVLSAALVAVGTVSLPGRALADSAVTPVSGGAAPAAQNAPARPHHGFAALDLSPAQKTQLASIHESTRQQILAVLTPEQRTQLNAGTANEQNEHAFGRSLRGLTLSAAQKTQIRAIHVAARQQMMAVLTPEQQARMQAMHAHGPRGGPAPVPPQQTQ